MVSLSHFIHLQKSHCSSCAYHAARKRTYNWSLKLYNVHRRFLDNFRERTEATPRKKRVASA
uniref:60S ribosomal protein L37 n=1 Tax=Solanum lycopersicum TaxID=4081 RepID=A0A3Q7JA93_SOLLC